MPEKADGFRIVSIDAPETADAASGFVATARFELDAATGWIVDLHVAVEGDLLIAVGIRVLATAEVGTALTTAVLRAIPLQRLVTAATPALRARGLLADPFNTTTRSRRRTRSKTRELAAAARPGRRGHPVEHYIDVLSAYQVALGNPA